MTATTRLRLSDLQSEGEFLKAVTDYATLKGWLWVHFRPGRTADSWRTAFSGPLGKGWPDLVLLREKDKRLLFVELKRDGAVTTPDQRWVLNELRRLEQQPYSPVEVYLWHPSDWPVIEVTLR